MELGDLSLEDVASGDDSEGSRILHVESLSLSIVCVYIQEMQREAKPCLDLRLMGREMSREKGSRKRWRKQRMRMTSHHHL